MTMYFPKHEVRPLVEHAAGAAQHTTYFGDGGAPGLFLVGDRGVYLISSGLPQQPRADGSTAKGARVSFALGIDPETDDFDDWWNAKQDEFGGDDGAIFFPIDGIRRILAAPGDWIAARCTPRSVRLESRARIPSDLRAIAARRQPVAAA